MKFVTSSLICSCVLLAGCSSSSSGGSGGSTTTPVSPTVSNPVTVSGIHLLRNGATWTPHGVVMIAFVAPPGTAKGVYLSAANAYTPAEFTAIQAWGADTVRMQVSQPGLDPQNALFTQSFVNSVQAAVTAARAAGLNVIISDQDESQSGETSPTTLPNAATQRVWAELAPLFNGDTGIMYEMMNEPQPTANTTNWGLWQTAMNAVITTIRNTGSKNVLLADGLQYAGTFSGAPLLTDPLGQVAYASHPYFYQASDETTSSFMTRFGNFAQTAPVVVTEWSTPYSDFCDSTTPAASLTFEQYLQSTGIGLMAFAYDLPTGLGSITTNFSGSPTTFANSIACGTPGFGPGKITQVWYDTGIPSTILQ